MHSSSGDGTISYFCRADAVAYESTDNSQMESSNWEGMHFEYLTAIVFMIISLIVKLCVSIFNNGCF